MALPAARACRGEDDYERMREFLREVFRLNGGRAHSWYVARLDYWRWHGILNCGAAGPVEDVTFVWETPDGRIAAVLCPEERGEAFLHVHPAARTAALEEAMIALAEERLAAPTDGGTHRLRVWADAGDALRESILARRGYAAGRGPEYKRVRPLDVPVAPVPLAPGYSVRALGADDELPRRSWASWKAFHPREPDERYQGWQWYRNVRCCPLYRRDLDIVAAAPDGEIAAFCTVWFDPATRSGMFEPVGTMPAHQRRGLGKAVMAEGLRRLQALGATLAMVGSYDEPAHTLYRSMGFTDYDLANPWVMP